MNTNKSNKNFVNNRLGCLPLKAGQDLNFLVTGLNDLVGQAFSFKRKSDNQMQHKEVIGGVY